MGIKYSDSEVNVFHPLCEKALTAALQKLNLQKKYRVIHHQYTGSLEMDFCIQNQATKKYLCVIEVKRTPADVHSSRYQFQALSYVQSNEGNNEKPFYILTNLEYAFAFRYDKNRPRVFQQMLKPGLTSICNFGSQSDQEIVDELTDYFANSISDFVRNNYDYLVTLDEFANHMEQIKNNSKLWKSHLAVLLYEYIRGAFTFINRNDLKDIRLFNGDVKRICDEAVRINFKDIFTYDPNEFESKVSISGSILSDLFDFGSQNINADSVAGVLHQIVSSGQEHNGEVPTDLELGILVAELAKSISGELSENEKIFKPQELYDLVHSYEGESSDDQESDFGQWIPCDEKLPEKSGLYNVLVIDENGKRSICSGIFEVIEDGPMNERRSVCISKRWHPVCSGTVMSWREYPAPRV